MALTKKLGYLQGMKVEAGNSAFAGSAVTDELETTMTTVLAFLGTTQDKTALISDKTVTASKLTVTRAASGTSSGTYDYVLYGW